MDRPRPTLRDLRRMLGRRDAVLSHTPHEAWVWHCPPRGWRQWVNIAVGLPRPCGGPEVRVSDSAEAAKFLDRLISQYGHDYAGPSAAEPEPAERPKKTSEVRDVSDNPSLAAAYHGGDGNSGECDHAAQTKGAQSQSQRPPDSGSQADDTSAGKDAGDREPPEAPSAAAEAPGQSPRDAADSNEPERSAAESTDSAAEQIATATDRGDSPADVNGSTDDPAETPAGDWVDAADDDKSGTLDGSGLTLTEPPFSAKDAFGGTFDDEELSRARARADRGYAPRIAKALRRLLDAMDFGVEDQSPRINATRLVAEMAVRRYNLARTRKYDRDLPLVLLLCDVSGSCSAVCNDTLAACVAIAEHSALDVHVLRHSNGLLVDDTSADGQYRSITDYVSELRRPIGAVVAFGDWDAGRHYQKLCESGAKLVWLDSYCGKHPVAPASKTLRASALTWKRQPLAWYQGVNSAASALHALNMAVRAVRRQ